MGSGVALEFGGGEKVGPGLGVIGAKDSEVGFDLLVGAFGLSISLGVVSSGETDIIVEESGEFPGKGGGELRSSIRDQSVMETESLEYVVEKE